MNCILILGLPNECTAAAPKTKKRCSMCLEKNHNYRKLDPSFKILALFGSMPRTLSLPKIKICRVFL